MLIANKTYKTHKTGPFGGHCHPRLFEDDFFCATKQFIRRRLSEPQVRLVSRVRKRSETYICGKEDLPEGAPER
jgi:hypothetical protein